MRPYGRDVPWKRGCACFLCTEYRELPCWRAFRRRARREGRLEIERQLEAA